MSGGSEEIGRLEELAMNAWPAEVIQTVEGWRLRFTDGVSRRANSVWSNQTVAGGVLRARIAVAEEFYRQRASNSCFHVSPQSPPQLDEALTSRGYHRNGDTLVQRVPLADLLSAIAATQPSAAIEHHPTPTPAWEQVAWPHEDLRPEVRRGIVRRIGPPCVFALAVADGRPVAAGLGVVEREHVGIFSMRTQESARRGGYASAVLGGLASWGASLGARVAYLQVEADNPGAQRLYAKAGFRTVYGYHYRSLAMAEPASD